MKELIISACVVAFVFGLLVMGHTHRETVTRDCNDAGGLFIDGLCQKPQKGN